MVIRLWRILPLAVVWCLPSVRHWHGAAPTAALTHIAVTGSQAKLTVKS